MRLPAVRPHRSPAAARAADRPQAAPAYASAHSECDGAVARSAPCDEGLGGRTSDLRRRSSPARRILAAVHFDQLTAPEQRVLGCLIEKRWTTPEQYPLSLNALRLACNQATNRDPVTGYDEDTVRDAAQRLSRYGLARLASGHSSRSIKYRHLAEEALGLDREQLALLAVLLLRGPQTPGELKPRSERMAPAGHPGRRGARAGRAGRARLRPASGPAAGPEGGPVRAAAGGGRGSRPARRRARRGAGLGPLSDAARAAPIGPDGRPAQRCPRRSPPARRPASRTAWRRWRLRWRLRLS